MDKIEIYRGFEIRAFEREQGRWRAEIRKADGSTLKILVGDSGHRMSITTSADTLTAETSIDEVKKANGQPAMAIPVSFNRSVGKIHYRPG